MRIEINVSKESVEKMITYMKENSDECYTCCAPYPPSDEWVEFREALEAAYKKVTK